MYNLDYDALVQALRLLVYSGEFRAEIPPQAALKEGGYAILHAQGGEIISCFILNKNGKKLYHDAEAQRQLPRLGILTWQTVSSATPKTATPISPSTVPEAKPVQRDEGFIPRRRLVPETQMRTWSTLERSVYSLANGTRTVEQIAKLLSRPVQTIEQVIHNFEILHAIEWHRR